MSLEYKYNRMKELISSLLASKVSKQKKQKHNSKKIESWKMLTNFIKNIIMSIKVIMTVSMS